jgi:predicted ATPase
MALCAPKITRLKLKRFRSIRDDSFDLSNPLFLVGKNGAGKSNVIDALSFLSECMSQPLQSVFDKRGGIDAVRYRAGSRGQPGNVSLQVDFDFTSDGGAKGAYLFEIKARPNHGFEVIRELLVIPPGGFFERDKGKFWTVIPGLNPLLDPQALALPLLGGAMEVAPILKAISSIRVYSIQPAQVRELQDPDVGLSLRPDGRNAASVLQRMAKENKGDFRRLCEVLSTIVPGTSKVTPVKHGKKISLEFMQDWGGGKKAKFEAYAMSDGTLRALGILAAIWQKPRPALIVVEEPEAGLHPHALGAILDIIRIASTETQVVVTTHSPELLEAKWIEARNLRVVQWAAGATRVLPLGQAPVEALRRHLMGPGELFRSNALEPDDVPVAPNKRELELQNPRTA